jgi:biotin carboxylase
MNKTLMKILILGANDYQVTIILRAKAMGLYTVVCDPRDYMPGFAIADTFYQVDCFDVDKIVEIGKKEHVIGIITNSEYLLNTMSLIASKLHLRSLDVETINLFCDKFLMREHCKKIGINQPEYQYCSNLQEAIAFFKRLKKKCIIKPLDNCGSKGVYSINTQKELEQHFGDSLSNAYYKGGVLIEEYIEGTEFTVDGIKTSNGHKCLAISEKKHYEHNENVACRLYFSNQSSKYDYSLLRQQNDLLVDSANLPFSLTHAEYKFYNGKFYLIEIQARGGGSFIASDIVPYISGIDVYTKYIEWCVGKDVIISFSYDELSERCAVLNFFDSDVDEGVVSAIEGEGLLRNKTKRYFLKFNIGDRVLKVTNDATRIGYYIACEENDKKLKQLMSDIKNEFKIILNNEKR